LAPDNVGLSNGDESVNRDAAHPSVHGSTISGGTIALREGAAATAGSRYGRSSLFSGSRSRRGLAAPLLDAAPAFDF